MAALTSIGLWHSAFKSKNDNYDAERDRLRLGLDRMRENVSQLIKTIPTDCKDLTVHDVTHLDAVAEMATLIAGDEWPINPAEAFVLGGAILLHDAGMSAAAFAGGLDELKGTDEWEDIAASILRENGVPVAGDTLASPPADLLPRIKFDVLRALHAEQAEKMATTSWSLPAGDSLTLLEDHELRIAFGASIGRIAHSHHWNIEKVADQLLENVGSGTAFPPEWSINEKKIACILRCADASHIDRRRAPPILLAATRPTGLSAAHWEAQSKINKPALRDGTLIYTAGQTYKQAEAGAWWVAYDLITLADKEIRTSNALLEEIGVPSFQVSRILGAGSARALSRHLRPDGWRPVDAEVRVTDPIHLARTLGGSRLYGHDPLAPVRELLQNAADAVRARRLIEERGTEWGAISVTLEESGDEKTCWLHIDDNGVGMTERVLSGPLIDFGKSIWNSPLLRDEFPGLQSKNIRPIGKFGIGFFSVFELGEHVKVISRRYDAGIGDAKCLEFQSLSSRPLLRAAKKGELPRDTNTRVSVLVANKDRICGKSLPRSMKAARAGYRPATFGQTVRRLVAMLDVQVSYNDMISDYSFRHDAEIYSVSPETFIEELLPSLDEESLNRIKKSHASLIAPIISAEGERIGRAAIQTLSGNTEDRAWGAVSVGGFVYSSAQGLGAPYIGVIDGDTDQAARQVATSKASQDAIAAWATSQAQLIDSERYLTSQLMEIAENIKVLNGDPGLLPFYYTHMGPTNLHQSRAIFEKVREVWMPFTVEYTTWFKLRGYNDLGPNYFNLKMADNVVILRKSTDRLFEEELGKKFTTGEQVTFTQDDFRSNGLRALSIMLEILRDVWKADLSFSVEARQIFDVSVFTPPQSRWAMIIKPV